VEGVDRGLALRQVAGAGAVVLMSEEGLAENDGKGDRHSWSVHLAPHQPHGRICAPSPHSPYFETANTVINHASCSPPKSCVYIPEVVFASTNMTVTGAGRQKARMMSSPGASIVKGSRIVQWHLAGMWSAYGDGTFLLPHLESEA
jgi:hypothetical protein